MDTDFPDCRTLHGRHVMKQCSVAAQIVIARKNVEAECCGVARGMCKSIVITGMSADVGCTHTPLHAEILQCEKGWCNVQRMEKITLLVLDNVEWRHHGGPFFSEYLSGSHMQHLNVNLNFGMFGGPPCKEFSSASLLSSLASSCVCWSLQSASR